MLNLNDHLKSGHSNISFSDKRGDFPQKWVLQFTVNNKEGVYTLHYG